LISICSLNTSNYHLFIFLYRSSINLRVKDCWANIENNFSKKRIKTSDLNDPSRNEFEQGTNILEEGNNQKEGYGIEDSLDKDICFGLVKMFSIHRDYFNYVAKNLEVYSNSQPNSPSSPPPPISSPTTSSSIYSEMIPSPNSTFYSSPKENEPQILFSHSAPQNPFQRFTNFSFNLT